VRNTTQKADIKQSKWWVPTSPMLCTNTPPCIYVDTSTERVASCKHLTAQCSP